MRTGVAPDPRVPIKSGAKPELLRELIDEPRALREKIVEDERVAVAEKQHAGCSDPAGPRCPSPFHSRSAPQFFPDRALR